MSSATKPQPGFIKDCLLYAGTFHEMAIYLMPNIFRVLVPNKHNFFELLNGLGFKCGSQKSSVIFINESDYQKTLEFRPTVFTFEKKYFTKTPSNEYVSKEPVTASRWDTYSMTTALEKWEIELLTVPNVRDLHKKLKKIDIGFNAQD